MIYFAAGQWPSSGPNGQPMKNADGTQTVGLTRNLNVILGVDGVLKKFEFNHDVSFAQANATYTAELWKSVDGGSTWKNLISDEGNFYFNDVHCYDDTHCVVVGEGFADGGDPGARVFATDDGENFKLVHKENTLGTESLMAAKMVSSTEHWVGGTSKAGGLIAPTLLLHSKDAGSTYTNENNGVIGQMITNIDVVSATHAYATSINAAQASNLLEYGGSSPPAPSPSPPAPGSHHYEKPPCEAGEVEASLKGASGKLCAPPCVSGNCPTDVLPNVTASPQCVLSDQSGNKYCALICTKATECDQSGGGTCSILSAGKGVCTYPGTVAMTLAHVPAPLVVV